MIVKLIKSIALTAIISIWEFFNFFNNQIGNEVSKSKRASLASSKIVFSRLKTVDLVKIFDVSCRTKNVHFSGILQVENC